MHRSPHATRSYLSFAVACIPLLSVGCSDETTALPEEPEEAATTATSGALKLQQYVLFGDEIWHRAIPTHEGEPNWGGAGGWKVLSGGKERPGSGALHGITKFVVGDALHEWLVRGDTIWIRESPVDAFDRGSYHEGSKVSELPGTGDLLNVTSYVDPSQTLIQGYWRADAPGSGGFVRRVSHPDWHGVPAPNDPNHAWDGPIGLDGVQEDIKKGVPWYDHHYIEGKIVSHTLVPKKSDTLLTQGLWIELSDGQQTGWIRDVPIENGTPSWNCVDDGTCEWSGPLFPASEWPGAVRGQTMFFTTGGPDPLYPPLQNLPVDAIDQVNWTYYSKPAHVGITCIGAALGTQLNAYLVVNYRVLAHSGGFQTVDLQSVEVKSLVRYPMPAGNSLAETPSVDLVTVTAPGYPEGTYVLDPDARSGQTITFPNLNAITILPDELIELKLNLYTGINYLEGCWADAYVHLVQP